MTRRTWSLRERGEALYAAGLDVGAGIIEACDAIDDWNDADDALVAIGEAVDMMVPADATYDAIVDTVKTTLKELRNAAAAAEAAASLKDAEIDRLRAAMQRHGIAPPPPVEAVATRLPPVRPHSYRDWRPPSRLPPLDDLDDDIPF
jgi:hypothetical protein